MGRLQIVEQESSNSEQSETVAEPNQQPHPGRVRMNPEPDPKELDDSKRKAGNSDESGFFEGDEGRNGDDDGADSDVEIIFEKNYSSSTTRGNNNFNNNINALSEAAGKKVQEKSAAAAATSSGAKLEATSSSGRSTATIFDLFFVR